ncbi:MAG: hypothetical protein PHS14_06480 [Elusimicrobia bacterium]|nr:hypothetical protein [Elusimicrobiota bacterium]
MKRTAIDIAHLRSTAEEAVHDMKDGDMKVKAFEVVLKHLLESGAPSAPSSTKKAINKAAKTTRKQDGPTARIADLIETGIFDKPCALGIVHAALRDLGHLYPLSTVSVTLLRLARDKKLRRVREGGKYLYAKW